MHPTGAALVLLGRDDHPAGTCLGAAKVNSSASASCKTAPSMAEGPDPLCVVEVAWTLQPKPPKLLLVSFYRSLNYDPIAPPEVAVLMSRVPSFVYTLL